MAYKIDILDEGILVFTIDREEKRNAVSFEVLEGLERLIDEAGSSSVKAVAITGTGEKAFCSGGDLSEFHVLKTKEDAFPMLSKASEVLYSLATLPLPTVAVLNGAAVGGGCELAAACDFRIAARGIKAGFIQGRQGITTGWGGASLLSEKLPGSAAMKMQMGASVHLAEELASIGFIDLLFEGSPLEALRGFLADMLLAERAVLEGYKRVWIDKWERAGLKERIAREVEFCSVLWETDVHHQQVAKFLHKKN